MKFRDLKKKEWTLYFDSFYLENYIFLFFWVFEIRIVLDLLIGFFLVDFTGAGIA